MALIINADMPKACGYCFAYDDEYCQCSLEPSYDGHWSRENHCPILGEIPDKHGRLIDADALIKRNRESKEILEDFKGDPTLVNVGYKSVIWEIKDLENAPTVLEANNG